MDSAYARDVAAEVRAEMARQRVSQTALAEKLDVSQAYVSRRLAGDVAFDVAELDDVARILGVPVEQFVAASTASSGSAHAPHSVPQHRSKASVPPGRRGRTRRRPLDQVDRIFE